MGIKLLVKDLSTETKEFLAKEIPELNSETVEVEITADIYNDLMRKWSQDPVYENVFNDILNQAEITEGKKMSFTVSLDDVSEETWKVLSSKSDDKTENKVTIYGHVLRNLLLESDYDPSYEKVILDILMQDDLPPDVLSFIIKKTKNNSIFLAALKHKNTFPKDIREYMYDLEDRAKPKIVKIYLDNPNVTPKNIRSIAEYVVGWFEGTKILFEVSKNQKTDSDTLNWLVTDPKVLDCFPGKLLGELKMNVVKHPNTPKETLLELSNNSDDDALQLEILQRIV